MKQICFPTIPILLIGILSYCTPPERDNSLTNDEVAAHIDLWVGLWASYDLNQLNTIFWNSEHCTYLSSEKEGLIKGFEALIPHHSGFGFVEGGKVPAKELWLEDQAIQQLKTSSIVTATWYFGERSSPKDSIQNGPVTFVLIKDEQKEVKIAHTHFANYE